MFRLFGVLAISVLLMVPVSGQAQPADSQAQSDLSSSAVKIKYPLLAQCTGQKVRLRAAPSLDAKIVGQAPYWLYAVNDRVVDGEMWYEVDHPDQNGSAWIFGEFLNVQADEDITPAKRLTWQLVVDFGSSPAKARALFGPPLKEKKKNIPTPDLPVDKMTELTLSYPGFILTYFDDSFHGVEVTGDLVSFGPYRVGDSAEKLAVGLGQAETEDGDWTYHIDNEELVFAIQDGRIVRMRYVIPLYG